MDNMNGIAQYFVPKTKENEKPNEGKASGKPKQAAKKASGKPKQVAKKASNSTIKKGNGFTTAQKAAPRSASVKKTPGLRNNKRVVLDEKVQTKYYKQAPRGTMGGYDPEKVYSAKIQDLVVSANKKNRATVELRSAIWKHEISHVRDKVMQLVTEYKSGKAALLKALHALRLNPTMDNVGELLHVFPGNKELRTMVEDFSSITNNTAKSRAKKNIAAFVATLLKELADKVAPGDSEAEQNLKRIFDSNAEAVCGMTRNAKYKKSNDLAKEAKAAADAKRKEADQAKRDGLTNAKKLKQEADALELKAIEAKANSLNGKQNANRKKSNDLAKAAKAAADAKRKEAVQAKKEGRPNAEQLKQEADEAELKARDAVDNSRNGKKNATNSRKFHFADGFTLDRRTLFNDLGDAVANRMKYTKTKHMG